MPARVVLRKRIPFDPQAADLIRRRNRKPDPKLSQAIRNLGQLLPHLLQFLSGKQPPPTSGSGNSTPKFFSTWGLALRQDSQEPGRRDPKTGRMIFDWQQGRSPNEVRETLLEPSDVLTEITEGAGFGDLPTKPVFDNQERRSVAVDIGIEPARYSNAAQHWGNRRSTAATFGKARDAMRLVNAPIGRVGFQATGCQEGEDINIVIVDTGLNESYIRSLVPDVAFGGGFVDMSGLRPDPGLYFDPYRVVHSGHGNMIARNILRIAPKARIFDAPLLPDRVTNVDDFTHTVEHLYEAIQDEREKSPYAEQPWIIVNAWAVADNIQERQFGLPLGMLYSTGDMHNTNTLIQGMSEDFAILFAAGNNGTFEPAPGAGLYNRGAYRPNGTPPIENGRPHGSITGANALPGVLTVGACTVNGTWIGASSEGDGPASLKELSHEQAPGKPDLVAPSWFSEDNDRHQTNTGTSAACAVAAGLAAAAWSGDPGRSPQNLLSAMRDTAHSADNDDTIKYRQRMGQGIVGYPFW